MNTEERLACLEAEVDRLRRRVRGLRGATAGVASVAVAALLFGSASGQGDPPAAGLPGWSPDQPETAAPAVAEVIRARRFEVVSGDEEPTIIAVLGRTMDGGGFVEARNKAGDRAGMLSSNAAGNGDLQLLNTNGFAHFTAGTDERGAADVRVINGNGRTMVSMRTDPKGDGYLGVANTDGYDVGILTATAKHDGLVKAHDHVGKPLGVFGSSEDSEGMMRLHNAWGYPVFDFGTDIAKNGRLSVYGSEGAVLMSWPQLPPVEDKGDLPPAPPHLLNQNQQGAAPADGAAPAAPAN